MKHIRPRIQAVIFNEEHKLLLSLHKKKNSYYVLPGIELKYGEKFQEGLLRELREKLGITQAQVKQLLFIDEFIDDNRHIIHLSFLVSVPKDKLKKLTNNTKNKSIKKVAFFSTEDIFLSSDTFYPSKELFINILKGNQ